MLDNRSYAMRPAQCVEELCGGAQAMTVARKYEPPIIRDDESRLYKLAYKNINDRFILVPVVLCTIKILKMWPAKSSYKSDKYHFLGKRKLFIVILLFALCMFRTAIYDYI